MKVRMPEPFIVYASNYTLKSMIEYVSYYALDIYKKTDATFGGFSGKRKYSLVYNERSVSREAHIVQTWMIDLMYDLICLDNIGKREITANETLHLINLHNNYNGRRDKKHFGDRNDTLLKVYGFLGEQKRFQNNAHLYNEFAREKYIMDVISKKSYKNNINVLEEFKNETGFSTDEYSLLIFYLFIYFSTKSSILNEKDLSSICVPNSIVSYQNLKYILKEYSATIEEIKNNPLKRQFFYTKPFIKIDDEYVLCNPFLLLCLFVNSNYWVMRNLYLNKKKDAQGFVNAFGEYFELYVEEIFNNCLNKDDYKKIPEGKTKKADWYLKLGGYEFLIEQKSAVSILGIKQNYSDISKMKQHMLNTWGKAVKQLHCTEIDEKVVAPIKIILVYEDYYKGECLDELFKLESELIDDKKYWLVNINEFEMLMMTYKEDPKKFEKIICEKDDAERIKSLDGRDPLQILHRNNIRKNKYIESYKIEEFEKILRLIE